MTPARDISITEHVMSEYQYVAFRAIDAPVSKDNLDYMRCQSTRAEITPWRFDNEYHYGDFRGDALEMLRRGYDLHLHYANFGIRSLFIRLPHGLPRPKSVKPYLDDEALRFRKDRAGVGGTLVIQPQHESGELDELWDVDGLIERLIPLRAEILAGDLRPFYLAHLAAVCDSNQDPDETTEALVPAGLADLTDAQLALAELYGLETSLLTVAAEASPPLPAFADRRAALAEWIAGQSDATKNVWLVDLVNETPAAARAEVLAKFNKARSAPAWPTVRRDRAISQLRDGAERLERAAEQQAAASAARARTKKLADIAADPKPYLRETEQLVKTRSTANYDKVAQLLAEVREALAAAGKSNLAEQQAQKLKAAHPTLRHLTAALRREGFVPK